MVIVACFVQSSRDILLAFSRDLLRGEGDVTRHLSHFGYVVTHVQTVLDEYDYAVSNLAVDLRDGLKLTSVPAVFHRLTHTHTRFNGHFFQVNLG